MAHLPKPSTLEWASTILNNSPTGTPSREYDPADDTRFRENGWVYGEFPPYQVFNEWMYRVYKWNEYFEEQVEGIIGSISSDLTVIVRTTGNDVSGDGTLTLPFATPTRAMEFLFSSTIVAGVTVTIDVGAGTYTFAGDLDLNHPTGGQIKMIGATLAGSKPSGVVHRTWATPASASTTAGGYIVTGNELVDTAGELPATASAGARTTARANDKAANDSLLRARYTTILDFTGGGIVIKDGNSFGLLDNLLIINGSVNPVTETGVLIESASSCNFGANVAVHGFGIGVWVSIASSLQAHDITVSGCSGLAGLLIQQGSGAYAQRMTVCGNDQIGALVAYTGSGDFLNITASGNGTSGIESRHSAAANCVSGYLSGNGKNGADANGSTLELDLCSIEGNGETGTYARLGASVQSVSAGYKSNGDHNVYSEEAVVNAESATIENAGNVGVLVGGSASVNIVNSTVIGSGGNQVQCTGSSNVNATGSTITGNISAVGGAYITCANQGTATFSPAYGVTGNGSAHISAF